MWTDLASGSIHGAIGGSVPAQNIIEHRQGKAGGDAVEEAAGEEKMPDVPTFIEQGCTATFFGLSGYTRLGGAGGHAGRGFRDVFEAVRCSRDRIR